MKIIIIQPEKWYLSAAKYGGGSIFGIIAAFFIFKFLKTKWLKYQASIDRSYNVFDKAELSSSEKRQINSFEFVTKQAGSPTKSKVPD